MMNALSFFANHLWQSTVFAAIAALLTLGLKDYRAETRFWLFLTASLKFLVPFSVLASIGTYLTWPAKVPPPIRSGMLVAIEPFRPSLAPLNLAADSPVATHTWTWSTLWPMSLSLIWLCGIAVVAGRSWRSSHRVAAIAHRAKPLLEGPEAEIMERVSRTLGLALPIPILESQAIVEPGVFGIVTLVLL